MIFRTIQPEQIVSLRLDTQLYFTESQLTLLAGLTNVVSLNLLNFQSINLIHIYEEYFPQLTHLSLWYDNEVDLNRLFTIMNYIRSPIRRFEIYCGEIICSHQGYSQLSYGIMNNFTVNYFLIDISHSSLPLTNACCLQYVSCSLTIIIDFIKKLNNIRHIHFITNRYHLNELLDEYQWNFVAFYCKKLKTINIEIRENISEEQEALVQKVMRIQNILKTYAPVVKFQVLLQ